MTTKLTPSTDFSMMEVRKTTFRSNYSFDAVKTFRKGALCLTVKEMIICLYRNPSLLTDMNTISLPGSRICYTNVHWQQHPLKSRSDAAPINSRLNVVVRSPTPFGLGRNGCWPLRGSQLPRALPSFFAMLPPERPQKGSTQLLQNRSPVFSFSLLLPVFVSSFFSFS